MQTIQVPRMRQHTLFQIKFPIWNGGSRVVGLALDRMTDHNEVEILYVRKKDGIRIYPDRYYVDGRIAKVFYNRQTLPSGVELVLVPVENLMKIERV
jgi:hypothetical protein